METNRLVGIYDIMWFGHCQGLVIWQACLHCRKAEVNKKAGLKAAMCLD